MIYGQVFAVIWGIDDFFISLVQVGFEGFLQQMTFLSIVTYSTYVVKLQRRLCEKF